MSDEHIALLPPLLQELARGAGMRAVFAFVEAFGGERRYIPSRPREGQPIVRAVGIEAARILAELKGNEWVEVPQAKVLRDPARALRAAILAADGPHGEVAHALRISHSWVKKVRRRNRTGAGKASGARRRPAGDDRQIDIEAWLAGPAKRSGEG